MVRMLLLYVCRMFFCDIMCRCVESIPNAESVIPQNPATEMKPCDHSVPPCKSRRSIFDVAELFFSWHV